MFNVDITKFGPDTLIGVFVLLVWLGYFVPRKTFRSVEKDRDTWKEACFALLAMDRAKSHQLGEVLKTAETTRSVLEAIVPSPLESTPDEKTTV